MSPPMPPPPGGMPVGAFFSGFSATIASVVISRPATDSGALQRGAHDLGRIDDAGLDHVDVLALLGVEAEVDVLLVEHACRRPRRRRSRHSRRSGGPAPAARGARSRCRPAGRGWRPSCSRARGWHRADAAPPPATTPSSTAALVACMASSTRSLLLLDLDLGGAADLDDRHAAGELGQPLLQLLAVVVGGRLLDLRLDLRDAALDVLLLARAVDDRGVVLVDDGPSWPCPACRA